MTELLKEDVTPEQIEENERAYWIEKAKLVGCEFPKNITTAKLKTKVKEFLAKKSAEQVATGNATADTFRGELKVSKLAPTALKAQNKALALVRFKITVINPQLSSATGIFVTAGNSNVSPVTRMIPFNAPVWHAERIIVEALKARKHQVFSSEHSARLQGNFDNIKAPKQVPDFIIEELPPLTEEELKQLAVDQESRGTGKTDTSEEVRPQSL